MTYSPENAFTFPFDPNFPLVPKINFVTAITQSNPAIVTTATPHGYTGQMFVRIVFPHTFGPVFGMPQIDEQSAGITVLSDTTFSIAIDTRNYDPFTLVTNPQMPQCVPIGVTAPSSANDSGQVNPVNNSPRPVIFQPIAPAFSAAVNVP